MQAACREIREETGIILAPHDLGEPVAVNSGEWSLRGGRYYSLHTYFFARVSTVKVTGDDGLGHRWWTAAGLDAATERIFPPGLAVLVKDLFQGVRHERPVPLDW